MEASAAAEDTANARADAAPRSNNGDQQLPLEHVLCQSHCDGSKVHLGLLLFRENGVRPANILQIDAEGFEVSVIRGLQRPLSEDRPVILLEMSEETRRLFGRV